MYLNAMSELSGVNMNSLGSALTVPQAPAVAQSPAAKSTAVYPPQPSSPVKPQPFLLVPTEPLSPTVLAELIGRQISLNGPTPS